MSFLDEYMNSGKGRRPSDLSRETISTDRFDREDEERLRMEMQSFYAARHRLKDFTPTGDDAFGDAFYALVKALPKTLDPGEIRPSHIVNRTVAEEIMGNDEYDRVRLHTTHDTVAAALAAIDLEPTLETIFDKLKAEQELAQQLHDQMMESAGLDAAAADLDDLMDQANSGEGVTSDDGEPVNYQERRDLIERQREQLRQQMQQTAEQLEQSLGDAKSKIRAELQAGLSNAADSAKDLEVTNQMWGIEPGAYLRLPVKERLEMAKRFRNDRFRKIAQLFGPLRRMAFAEQKRRTDRASEEIYSVETGNDLSRILPAEFLNLTDPDLEFEFLRRYVERNLAQYQVKGVDTLSQGGIIWCEDGSGSMSGDREIWAKAVGLTLLHIAQQQKRSFYGIHFGSAGEFATFDFRDPKKIDLEKAVEFAEVFFAGGTDFMTPLSAALDLLREEYDRFGATKADIVFCTDGQCGVDPEWLDEFKDEQNRLGFKVYGIVVGGNKESEPLATICDGRVLTVADLRGGEDVRTLFKRL